MANSHLWRQDDPVEAANARFWREYDAAQPADISIRDELAARKSALRSIDEVQGEFEGDDYWALGADPNVSGAEALARMRRGGAERSECDPNPVEVVHMHGQRYFGDEDLDDDADADRSDEECDDSDCEDADAEPLGPAAHIAHCSFGSRRITELVAAFERLQGTSDNRQDFADEEEEIIDALFVATERRRLPHEELTAIVRFARRDHIARARQRTEEYEELLREDHMETLCEIQDDLATARAELQGMSDLIKREIRSFCEGQLIWKRDNPSEFARFVRFKDAGYTSLQTQHKGSTATFEYSIYCWAIGVFNMPDCIVNSILRLARLFYVRAMRTIDVYSLLEAKHEMLIIIADEDDYSPWEDSQAYQELVEFRSTADGAACDLHERTSSRYGYEPQPSVGGEVLHPKGYAKFVEPTDVPFLRRLEIIRAGFDIRVVRHAQSLRDPERVRKLANPRLDRGPINSHRHAGPGVFAWIAEAVKHLAEDPHERTSEDKEARRLLCEDMINFATNLGRKKFVRKLMRLAVESVLVPYSAFAGYRGAIIAIPPNSRPKRIAQLEQQARAQRAQIIMVQTDGRNLNAWVPLPPRAEERAPAPTLTSPCSPTDGWETDDEADSTPPSSPSPAGQTPEQSAREQVAGRCPTG